jgi:hypothetical protein
VAKLSGQFFNGRFLFFTIATGSTKQSQSHKPQMLLRRPDRRMFMHWRTDTSHSHYGDCLERHHINRLGRFRKKDMISVRIRMRKAIQILDARLSSSIRLLHPEISNQLRAHQKASLFSNLAKIVYRTLFNR